MTSGAVYRSCLSPIFWLSFGNRYTHPGKGLCQVSCFIPEANNFIQILALAPLLDKFTRQQPQERFTSFEKLLSRKSFFFTLILKYNYILPFIN